MNNIIEHVTFTAKPGSTDQEMRAAFDLSNEVAQTIPGFIQRTLAKSADSNLWFDIVQWDSMEAAQNAMKAFESDPRTNAYVALIDFEHFELKHLSIIAP